jgi:hypothetical protein
MHFFYCINPSSLDPSTNNSQEQEYYYIRLSFAPKRKKDPNYDGLHKIIFKK